MKMKQLFKPGQTLCSRNDAGLALGKCSASIARYQNEGVLETVRLSKKPGAMALCKVEQILEIAGVPREAILVEEQEATTPDSASAA